jgi:hypothetical protein
MGKQDVASHLCGAGQLALGAFLILTVCASNALAAPPDLAQLCPGGVSGTPVVDAGAPDLAAGKAALVQKDYRLAYSHFHPLAESGNRDAQREFGFLLMQSCYGDRTPALRWIARAAEGGDVPSAATLGRLYMNGDGVVQNDAIAFQWLSKAANAGDPPSEANLGVLYLNGRGVPLDRYQGIVWLIRAAEQGDASALVSIGRAYSLGVALPRDERRALFWMAAAIPRAGDIQRNQFATIFKNAVRQVSPEDVRRIGQEAEKWSPGPGRLDDVLADAARQRQFVPAVPQERPQTAPRPANPGLAKGKRSA